MTSPEGRGAYDSVLSMVIEGQREIKEAVSALRIDLNTQMSRMPDQYVPRREVEHKFDEHTIDIGELRAKLASVCEQQKVTAERLEADIQAVDERRQTDERRRLADRRWVIGTTVTVLALLVAVLSLVLTRV